MLNGTRKAAGLLALCGALAACSGNSASPGRGGAEAAPTELQSTRLQTELDAFSTAAKLEPEQHAALLKHFQRFEKHYAVLAQSGQIELIDRLQQHDRILALSELRESQVQQYDASRLPGSRSFTADLLQPAAGAP